MRRSARYISATHRPSYSDPPLVGVVELRLPLGLHCGTIDEMTVQPQSRKRPGPAPTGKGMPVQVRLQPGLLAKLDAFIADQPKPVSRPEAIRALAEAALELIGEAKK
jgi:hypothetical protein